jgi:hypothetical protein
MFGHSVTMPNRPFPSPPKDLWDVGRTQFPSNTYKALRCEQLEGFEKNPSLCQASEVKCPWTIKCRKLKHSNATFHIFHIPYPKDRDSGTHNIFVFSLGFGLVEIKRRHLLHG